MHFVMKASHLSSYVKGCLRFPKMVVGTLGNVWESYSENLKVKVQCVNGEVRVRLANKACFHTAVIKNYNKMLSYRRETALQGAL